MKFTLDINQIKKDFEFKDGDGDIPTKTLKHNHAKKIRILPYNTKPDKDSIRSFNSSVGEFARLVYKKDATEDFNLDSVFENMMKKIIINKANEKINFKVIIKELFFDSDNELKVFHPTIFNYLKRKGKENKKLAEFLYSILCSQEIKEMTIQKFYNQSNNMLIKLMIESLPELTTTKGSVEKYHSIFPTISEVFSEDFKFIIENENQFVEGLEKLLKYYYYFYVSQMSIKLNKMFEAKPEEIEPIYFTLDWESISKTRTSYNRGWDLLSSNIRTLFSHVICLELLNYGGYNEIENGGNSYSYSDLKNIIELMNDVEISQFETSLDELTELYKEYRNVDWTKLNVHVLPYDNVIYNKIFILYKSIDYQFNNSVRNKNYKDYRFWFEEYCRINFLKQRGPLGKTLNITKEYLVFITKLCMKDQEKIRLKKLFEEYKRRGLFFDRDSEEKIVQFFERLNLLEKKSDSGDAQYVRSIL